jgi:hypothetical protein
MPEPTSRLPKAYYRTMQACCLQAWSTAETARYRIDSKIRQTRTHALRTLSESAVVHAAAIATNRGLHG